MFLLVVRNVRTNSKRYGHAMNINKIVTLSEDIYEEPIVNQIFPNWEKNARATHTLNFDENLTVIDALIRKRK